MICTRCKGTGFLNVESIDESELTDTSIESIKAWIDRQTSPHDVSVCDCCGDGDSEWYGIAGHHYIGGDLTGPVGPYSYNGGLCECH